MTKTIVGILCNSSAPHKSIYSAGIIKTFGASPHENVEIFPYFGIKLKGKALLMGHLRNMALAYNLDTHISKLHIRVNKKPSDNAVVASSIRIPEFLEVFDTSSLRFSVEETTSNVPLRFIAVLKYMASNMEFDYFWHSNVSTYLNIEALTSHTENLAGEDIYAGVIGDSDGIRFVSGACVCMSRSVVDLIIQNISMWNFALPWDVALGKLLSDLGVRAVHIPRKDLTSISDVDRLTCDEIRNTVNYRCKSGKLFRRDAKLMLALHSRLTD
jgi:hypothetical protein